MVMRALQMRVALAQQSGFRQVNPAPPESSDPDYPRSSTTGLRPIREGYKGD